MNYSSSPLISTYTYAEMDFFVFENFQLMWLDLSSVVVLGFLSLYRWPGNGKPLTYTDKLNCHRLYKQA